jgi:transposase InsO family protein
LRHRHRYTIPYCSSGKSTNGDTAISVLDKIFAEYGVPNELITDNGPPFNGKQFCDFANHLGFHHRKVTPYWPRANGLAERFMRNLGKVVRNAQLAKIPWQMELNDFLRAYRATPHSSTGFAPSELLFGRNQTSRLPSLALSRTSDIWSNFQQAKALNTTAKLSKMSKTLTISIS